MYNSSRDLDWEIEVAPVVSDYCGRMMAGGYSEKYRKDSLKHALAIYDDKVKKNDSGDVPLNRPKGYKKLERRKLKRWLCGSKHHPKCTWWYTPQNVEESCSN